MTARGERSGGLGEKMKGLRGANCVSHKTLVGAESPRNSLLLTQAGKHQRSASLLADKRSLLVLSSNRKAKARGAKSGWPGQGGQSPGGAKGRPEGPPGPARGPVARSPLCGKKSQERESFVLRTDTVGETRIRELPFDWWVKWCQLSPRETGLPKHSYVWGSVSPNSYLAPESICAFCICDGRQAFNQSCFMGFFFFFFAWALQSPPLPPSRPWDEYTVSRLPCSQLEEMIHTDFQGLPLPALSCCSERLAALLNQAQDYQAEGEPLLSASCIKFRLDCSGEGPAFISSLPAHSTVRHSHRDAKNSIGKEYSQSYCSSNVWCAVGTRLKWEISWQII